MEKTEIKNQLRSIYIVYWAMFIGVVLFTFVAGFLVSDMGGFLEADQQLAYVLYLVLILSLAVLIPFSYWFPQKMIKALRGVQKPLVQKLSMYRSASVIRFALLNSAGVMVAIWFLLLGNVQLFYIQVIILLIFIMFKPSSFKIAADLELDEAESEKLIRQEE